MKKILHSKIAGFSLIEALIAALIVGVGMLGLAKLQGELFISSSESRMRTHALNWAQDKIEEFRKVANQDLYSGFANGSDTVALAAGSASTNFTRNWTVTTYTNPAYKQISVTVAWMDSKGVNQTVQLTSNVAATQPFKSGVFLASQSTTTTASTATTASTTTSTAPTTTSTAPTTTTTVSTTSTTLPSTTTTTVPVGGGCSGLVNAAIFAGDIVSSDRLLLPGITQLNLEFALQINITPKPLAVCTVLTAGILNLLKGTYKGTYICTITGLPPDIVNINIGGNTVETSVNVELSDVLPSSLLELLAPVQTLLKLPNQLVCAKAKVNLPITINSELQVIVPKPP